MHIPYVFDHRLVLRTPRNPLSDSNCNITLPEMLDDKAFLEAIYLASPVLYSECVKCKEGELTNKKEVDKLLRTLLKYRIRMSSRCTPFGLFSGCAVVGWNNGATAVQVDSKMLTRHTRLDMHYLCSLAQQLAALPEVKNGLRYFANTTAYVIGEELRYVEYMYVNGERVHQLSAVSHSVYLQNIMEVAAQGATIAQLVHALMLQEVSEEDAAGFIEELIAAQLLVHEIEPSITGDEFLPQLCHALESVRQGCGEATLRMLDLLHEITRLLQNIDEGRGDGVAQYKQVIALLDAFGITYDESKLFQTDASMHASGNGVSTDVQHQLADALDALNKLNSFKINPNLLAFMQRFIDRYEDKEMPLQEVLDAEIGIGYIADSVDNMLPLVNDLLMPGQEREQQYSWGKLERLLTDKLFGMYAGNKRSITLQPADLAGFTAEWNTGTPSFAVKFRIVNEGADNIFLESAGGSSASNLLGRFAHADAAIHNLVNDITSQEQERDPGVIYAEIIHLPERRVGNILLHPVFRAYEIPYLTKSAVAKENQIDVQDLYVSVRNSRVILRSRRLGKEIIPRLSTAHNYAHNSLPVYRFLCDLQTQDKRNNLSFSWGSLQNQHRFLPRVTYNNTILHLARWQLAQSDVQSLYGQDNVSQSLAVKAFRDLHQLPQHVVLSENGNELLVDLEAPGMVNTWLDAIRKLDRFTLVEFLNEQQQIADENGRTYVNELVAVLHRNGPSYGHLAVPRHTRAFGDELQLRFVPGSEWVYYKLYCGIKSADKILLHAIKPMSEELMASGLTDKWFFIRYNDPEFHIRLRFHIADKKDLGAVSEKVHAYLQRFKDAGYIWKVQQDTYNRESERYGANTMELTESLFCSDSEAFLELLNNTWGNDREHVRWIWGLRAVDVLLNDFQYTLPEKYALLVQLRDAFAKEMNMTQGLKTQLNDKYREHKIVIAGALAGDTNYMSAPLISILEQRTQKMHKITNEILKIKRDEQLQVSINSLMGSYIHMLINRTVLTDARKQEMVMYDFLSRHYQSMIARENALPTCI